ncbi:MAG TPA: condensation domain-containing protein, partial [Chitinophagaceae bacterium]|nr:condensation domain-containing protein [Chitinophagaceae bacterium]
YLNRPALTKEKFLDDPFNAGERLYRTGDLGRWLPDGNIECLGRIDDQLKIRGYRIEPGEIENVLQQSGLVQQAVVIAKEISGSQQLVAYVVPGETFDKSALIDRLKCQLPAYMVPAVFVEMDSLPMTSNRKIDRKQLPHPDITSQLISQYLPARNKLDQDIIDAWQEIMALQRIGINDNFFQIGGHSLLAMRVISVLRDKLEIEVTVKDLFLHPTVAALSDHLLTLNKGLLLPPVQAEHRPARIPLSFSQERLWFIDQLEGSVQYHMPAVLRLKGELDISALQMALQTIIDRHEVLRTVILQEDDRPYQHVLEKSNWQLEVVSEDDLRNDRHLLQSRIQGLIARSFDLGKDYMLRAYLINLGHEDHVLALILHHIASDGWSISVIVRELVELYNAYTEGRAAQLPALPVQYADYALWQRKYLEGPVLDAQLTYWKEKLYGVQPLQMPTDHARPAVKSIKGSMIAFGIDKQLTKQLRELSQTQGVTLYMTLLAAFKALLHRYSGQEDICVGTPVAGRQRQEIEGLIGFFVNTLALRSHVRGDLAFADLLQQIKQVALEAYSHQEAPFEKIVETVVKDRDLSRSPLFQVMLVLQNVSEDPELSLGQVILEQAGARHVTSLFDINVLITETTSDLWVNIEYCTDLFERETIARFGEHFTELLRSVVRSPQQSVGSLNMLSAVERHKLQVEFNATSVSYSRKKTIARLFQEQASRTPGAVALISAIDGSQVTSLTYKELDELSDQLAHYLKDQGIKEDDLVAICIERGIQMVIGILAILKAGGAYVPLDPSYPEERLQYMVQDTAASVILSSSKCSSLIRNNKATIIQLDADWPVISLASSAKINTVKEPHHLGYVIYTSGSTGRPKGVAMPEKGLVNLLLWHNKQLNGRTNHRVLQFASINFDASFQEIFSAVCFGGSVVLVDEQERKDMPALLRIIEQYKINHLFIPYVVLRNLSEAAKLEAKYPSSLEMIFTAGEQLRLSDDIRQLTEKTGCRLLNYYGPSETHVVSSYEVVNADYAERPLPPIGKPISNTTLYIL